MNKANTHSQLEKHHVQLDPVPDTEPFQTSKSSYVNHMRVVLLQDSNLRNKQLKHKALMLAANASSALG